MFYIPDLKANLLSIVQLQGKGYVITFQNNENFHTTIFLDNNSTVQVMGKEQ